MSREASSVSPVARLHYGGEAGASGEPARLETVEGTVTTGEYEEGCAP
jgi:hypothetical protein